MPLTMTPDLPLTTAVISGTGLRGTRDYIVDLTTELESSEVLLIPNTLAISTDVSLVTITTQILNAAAVGNIAIGKGLQLRLQSQALKVKHTLDITIEYEGDSGTKGSGKVPLNLVEKT